jgi:GR25 family glycosyltransferase involved in LPS biosynthesis
MMVRLGEEMNTYYINLKSEEARRLFIEENFRQHGDPGGKLNRVEAVDAAYIVSNAVPGKISDTEKACFLSHRRAIDLSCRDDGPSLIVEDDARFGPSTFRLLDKLGDAFEVFDIIFTDIDLCNIHIHSMLWFFLLRRELSKDGTFRVLDLNGITFFGATAYVVNSRSKEKLLGLIDDLPSYELPYDIQLLKWIETGRLKAGFTFPFLTTVSSHSDRSGIQPMNTRGTLAGNAYRRLVWMDFEQTPENPVEALNRLDASRFDRESLYFAQILSLILSIRYS